MYDRNAVGNGGHSPSRWHWGLLLIGLMAAVVAPARADAAPQYKGIHAPNANGWDCRGSVCPVDYLSGFGSYVVLSSDLGHTNGRGGTVSDTMRSLQNGGARVIVRLFPTYCPAGAGTSTCTEGTRDSIAGDVIRLVQLYDWIKEIQVGNEPNIEWADHCTTSNCAYQWSDRSDQRFYQALNTFYSDAWYAIDWNKTNHPDPVVRSRLAALTLWSPPMAVTYIYANGQTFYAYLHSMISLYRNFAYHVYFSPKYDQYYNYRGAVVNETWDREFDPWLQNQISSGALRTAITELGWGPDRMYECGMTQYQTWLANPTNTSCRTRDGQNHEFSADLASWLANERHGAEVVAVWITSGFKFKGSDMHEGITDTGVVRPWFTNYRNLYNTAANDKLYIRAANATTDGRMQVFFKTSTSNFYSEDKSVWVPFPTGGNWGELVVDMSQNANWRGTITGLRIDPVQVNGYFGIDYVYVGTSGRQYVFTTDFNGASTVSNPFFGWTINNVSGLWTDGALWGGYGSVDPMFYIDTNFSSGR